MLEGSARPSEAVKVIEAVLGRSIYIHLWEDRTRGELWVPAFDSSEFQMLADDYLRVAGNNAVDNGRRTFEFMAIKTGSFRILFEKRLGWKFTAEDRRVFQVNVSCGPSAPKE